MARLDQVISSGTRSAQPDPGTLPNGALYYVTDEEVLEQIQAGAWATYMPAGSTALFSLAAFAYNPANSTPVGDTGNYTVGIRFIAGITATLNALQLYWTPTLAKTLKLCLWDRGLLAASEAIVATQNQAVNAAGVYNVTLAPSWPLTAGHYYDLTMWDNSGASYIHQASPPYTPPVVHGPLLMVTNDVYAEGDAAPTAIGGTDAYPIGPSLIVPA